VGFECSPYDLEKARGIKGIVFELLLDEIWVKKRPNVACLLCVLLYRFMEEIGI